MNFLPKEVQAGLDAARKKDMKRKTRMRVRVGDDIYPLLRFEENGFSLDHSNAPHLRGLVDLYDGARHLYQCLIVASSDRPRCPDPPCLTGRDSVYWSARPIQPKAGTVSQK